MPQKLGQALAYALLIWFIGFAWGTVVFMTPALKDLPPIPYVSRFPAISFPILLLWALITYLLARNYLKTASNPPAEGLRLGIVFALVNVILDLLVLVLLFGNGFVYFAALTVWVAYTMLVVLPWLVGRKMAANNT